MPNLPIRLLIAAFAFGATATPAFAQFEGPYVGAYAGFGQVGGDIDGSSASVSGLASTGATGGVFAGVASRLKSTSDLVIGMEADYGYSSGVAKIGTTTELLEIDPEWTIGVSGLLGYTPTDEVLAYAKLGWAKTRFDDVPGRGVVEVDGLRFGLGGEHALTNQLIFRAEIMHVESKSFSGTNARLDPAQTSITAGFRATF